MLLVFVLLVVHCYCCYFSLTGKMKPKKQISSLQQIDEKSKLSYSSHEKKKKLVDFVLVAVVALFVYSAAKTKK